MGQNTIEETPSYKYLGVIIDNRLSWKPQIDKMCTKLSSVCGIISKVRYILDRKSLLLIYNSLVESRLRYGILSWSTASNQLLDRLRVLQNRALRFIDFSPIGTTLLPIYAQFKVLPLSNLIELQRATYMFSFDKNDLPLVFRSYCKKPTHHYNTRFSEANFSIPSHKTRLSETSIKFIGPTIWSKIPIDLKKLQFRKTFSNKLKDLYLNQLPTEKRTIELDLNKTVISEEESDKTSCLEISYSLQEIFEENDENLNFIGF